jgi:organic hydroperoxide reductase OsmC/OhrA
MPTRVRVLEFDVDVDRDGTATSALGGDPIPPDEAWWAEHLVLAGLVRCTLTSLAYAARHSGVEAIASGRAHGRVTKRPEDGLYAFVDIEASYDVELTPAPQGTALTELLAWAERGCFVGNSLTARPRYRWRVNGDQLA